MTHVKKKTIRVPGNPIPQELYFGTGFIAISDVDGSARVEAQGYLAEELQSAVEENRQPIALYRQSASLSGEPYQSFKLAHPEFSSAVIEAAWSLLTQVLDTDTGQLDEQGNKVFVNFWADAEDVNTP